MRLIGLAFNVETSTLELSVGIKGTGFAAGVAVASLAELPAAIGGLIEHLSERETKIRSAIGASTAVH